MSAFNPSRTVGKFQDATIREAISPSLWISEVNGMVVSAV
jgi:hypothetical protein